MTVIERTSARDVMTSEQVKRCPAYCSRLTIALDHDHWTNDVTSECFTLLLWNRQVNRGQVVKHRKAVGKQDWSDEANKGRFDK